MSSLALTLVLSAAILHASWNGFVKAVPDRALMLAAISLAHAAAGVLLIAISDPPAMASWPSLAISTVVHYGYYALLFQAYRLGDLSQVYPISRGLAPAIVALSALIFIDENLSTSGWLGVAAISLGIGILGWQRGAANANRRAVAVAFALGLSIATYSFADGVGIRISGSPTGYMGWLFLLEFPVPLFVILWRMRNGGAFDLKTAGLGLVGGIFAVSAYGLVLFAKTIAPLGAVAAIRESSVIFAALIGLFVFGERPVLGRLIAAAIVATGVIVLAGGG